MAPVRTSDSSRPKRPRYCPTRSVQQRRASPPSRTRHHRARESGKAKMNTRKREPPLRLDDRASSSVSNRFCLLSDIGSETESQASPPLPDVALAAASSSRDLKVGSFFLTDENPFCDWSQYSPKAIKVGHLVWKIRKSIVGVSSFIGNVRIRACSGLVLESNESFAKILTSATLLSLPEEDEFIPPDGESVSLKGDLQVKVHLRMGCVEDGVVHFTDFLHNLAVIMIKADTELLPMVFKEDPVDVGEVVALGRSCNIGNIMLACGKVICRPSPHKSCDELVLTDCGISTTGIGGPMVDYKGRVLGISFYEECMTIRDASFLPSAVVLRCLKHLEKFEKVVRPWLGICLKSVNVVQCSVLQEIVRRVPKQLDGVYIDTVMEGSPAYIAGIRPGDILMEFDGKSLRSALELAIALLDKAEEHMEQHEGTFSAAKGAEFEFKVVFLRAADGRCITKSITAKETEPHNYFIWAHPIPSYSGRPRHLDSL